MPDRGCALTADAWVTLAVVVGMLVLLAGDLVRPVAAVLGAVVVLVLAGVLSVEEAFAGLANPATITIAALFVVARAVRESGGVRAVVARLLGDGTRPRRTLVALVSPVVAVSAVLNNTPIVATLAPLVRSWAESRNQPPSRYLMPLSFAAILGGLVTTIGTSTTLVVSGLVQQHGQPAFTLFEVTRVGLPIAVVGAVLLVLLTPKLLPDRESPTAHAAAHSREYVFRMRVVPFGPVDGRTVAQAGLRNLEGVFLARIERTGGEPVREGGAGASGRPEGGPARVEERGTVGRPSGEPVREGGSVGGADPSTTTPPVTVIAPVGPDDVLLGGDVLTFVGRVDRVRDLVAHPGLESAEAEHVDLLRGGPHRFYEVVVGAGSPLVGRTLKEVGFRERYDAAVVAIYRAGTRVDAKLGTVRLHVGDVLLVLSDRGFGQRWGDSRDFLLVSALEEHPTLRPRRTVLALGAVAAMMALAGTGVLTLAEAALAAVLLIVVTRTLTVAQARDAVDLDVLLIVAGAFGLGRAVEVSGLAGRVADAAVALGGEGTTTALAAVMLATLLLTELVSNTAAAALMVPIALDVAAGVGADPRPFAIAVAMMASASFLTPVGYQTNTMVYGLGGYRYTDYWRLGVPLTATVFALTLLLV